MHGVQIGNSLVGYGAGAGQEKARLPLRSPGTLEESHRQCTGRGGEGGKRKHSTRAPGKRAMCDGAKPSLQVNVTSLRRPGEEANPAHDMKGLLGSGPMLHTCICPVLPPTETKSIPFALQMGKLRLRGKNQCTQSHLRAPDRARAPAQVLWSPRLHHLPEKE